jgi:hypothetical protein
MEIFFVLNNECIELATFQSEVGRANDWAMNKFLKLLQSASLITR